MAALDIKNEQAREEDKQEDNHNEQQDEWTTVERKGLTWMMTWGKGNCDCAFVNWLEQRYN